MYLPIFVVKMTILSLSGVPRDIAFLVKIYGENDFFFQERYAYEMKKKECVDEKYEGQMKKYYC